MYKKKTLFSWEYLHKCNILNFLYKIISHKQNLESSRIENINMLTCTVGKIHTFLSYLDPNFIWTAVGVISVS